LMPLRLAINEEIEGIDVSAHGEEAYYGGDVAALAGRGIALGESVSLPAHEVPRPTR